MYIDTFIKSSVVLNYILQPKNHYYSSEDVDWYFPFLFKLLKILIA